MITGAKNIPSEELKDRLSEIPEDKGIIEHCATARRAEIAYNIRNEVYGEGAKHFKGRYKIIADERGLRLTDFWHTKIKL